jgi:hypothetical protein
VTYIPLFCVFVGEACSLQRDDFIGTHQTPPQVTILPRYLEVREGSPVEFNCEATGNPAPTLRWTISGNKQLNPEVSHMEYH